MARPFLLSMMVGHFITKGPGK